MSASGDKISSTDRVFELLSAHADNWLDDGQRQELLDLLRHDQNARTALIEHAILNSLLMSKARQNICTPSGCEVGGESDPFVDSAVELPNQLGVEPPNQLGDIFISQSPISNPFSIPSIAITPSFPPHTPLSSPPPLSFLGSAYHGTVGFFSQELPFGILVATLFMAMGGLIGSLITVEHYTQMPGQSRPSAGRSFASADAAKKMSTTENETDVQWVGRITGMVDCKWSDDKEFRPPMGDYVSLGRKYKLDTGLMEITYYTGAKVILQGPVTYEVESAAGGFLSSGKLTARVEKKVLSSQLSVASKSSPQPLAPSPLFAVRTPTATVTDLGTEFGVEVSKSGETLSHVFRGSVTLAALAQDGSRQGDAMVLGAGESAHVDIPEAGAARSPIVVRGEKDEKSHFEAFVRVLPRLSLLAYDEARSPAYSSRWQNGAWSGIGWATGWQLRNVDRPGYWYLIESASKNDLQPAAGKPAATDTDGVSFGLRATKGRCATAIRYFEFGDLPVGATVMVDFDTGRTAKESAMGIGLCNSSEQPRFIFSLADGRQSYIIRDGLSKTPIFNDPLLCEDANIPYTDKGLHVEMTRTGADTCRLKVVRLEDGAQYTFDNRTLMACSGENNITSFRAWNWAAGDGAEATMYFNRLKVIAPSVRGGAGAEANNNKQ